VRAEDHLSIAAANDGFELRRSFDAPVGAPDEIERPKDDVLGADGNRSGIGQHARELSFRAVTERARIFVGFGRRYGRIERAPKLEAVVRGGNAQVIFSSHDLAGALAQSPGGLWSVPVTPGGELQRERAIRLAVNIAMYVLCSNYKDDQVHAPFLMRRRAVESP